MPSKRRVLATQAVDIFGMFNAALVILESNGDDFIVADKHGDDCVLGESDREQERL